MKNEKKHADVTAAHVPRLLTVILALALCLRVWGIDFGLPYELTSDESKEILRALKLGAGEYYWGFGKGGLYLILFVEYIILFGYWWFTDRVAGATDFAVQFVRDPTMFFLLGRITVAIMGVLSCLVVFHIGKRIYDLRVGLGAAFIGATAYVHAAHSHIINVDIGMMLTVWGSLLAYLEYEKSLKRLWLIIAGMLAGLAIAFKTPGAIALPALFLAIASRPGNWFKPCLVIKDISIVTVASIAALTLIAPEWIYGIRAELQPYYWIFQGKAAPTGAFQGQRQEAFRLITTLRGTEWTGYISAFFQDYNLALTITALVGMTMGIFRKDRWTIIWTTFVVIFVLVMSSSNRGKPEYYLLPIVPCLWLLSSQAVVAIARGHKTLLIAGLAIVVALPVIVLVRQNVEWTQPDTRIVAKQWIETNIPTGARILMDSYQYRFIPSPPLTPDMASIRRQIVGIANEPGRFRGVSQQTMILYAKAMETVGGPAYELHPTVWGLAVKDVDYYAERCFDFIVISSMISQRYVRKVDRARFPKSAQFYDGLDREPRLQKVFSVEALPWQRPGPTITIYKLFPSCGEPQNLNGNSPVG